MLHQAVAGSAVGDSAWPQRQIRFLHLRSRSEDHLRRLPGSVRRSDVAIAVRGMPTVSSRLHVQAMEFILAKANACPITAGN